MHFILLDNFYDQSIVWYGIYKNSQTDSTAIVKMYFLGVLEH